MQVLPLWGLGQTECSAQARHCTVPDGGDCGGSAGRAGHCTALHLAALHAARCSAVQCTVQCRQTGRQTARKKAAPGEARVGAVRPVRPPHYTALHCTTLHYTALHCTTLKCTALQEWATFNLLGCTLHRPA